ncbi:MAG: glucose 1-dehydrogenase [Kiloniellales bacterium]
MGRLDGRIALITGGASGIGRATARRFVAEGARVVITDVNEADGAAAADELGADGLFLAHDVTDEGAWEAVVARALEVFGRLDVLLNGAGVAGMDDDIDACTLTEWRRVLAVNLEGVFLGCRHGVRAMRQTGGGSIVNISSVLGLVGDHDCLAYSASKGGVRLLTKSVALHCARNGYNIRCNSVHPGYLETPMVMDELAAKADPEARLEEIVALHPLGRLGSPEDVANMILFLASDEASFVTGAEFTVDGGYSAI